MKTRFVRLSPEGAMQYWHLLAPEIMKALPIHVTQTPDIALKLQEKILLGSIHCWLSLGNGTAYGIATTSVVVEPLSETRSLLVYTATTLGEHPLEMWSEAISVLKQFAISRNCQNITAYSSNQRMLQICALNGADVSTHLIKFDL